MRRSSLQPPSSEALTAPVPSQPTLKNPIDDAQADSREGVVRWLIFLLAGGVGLAHFLS
ncbi:MAG: hypothetical protein OJF50_001348 [Nitrospira sp.]|jgi:hypothetical protein|nr:hypothetical protein [Nitrospira sp.]